MNGSRLLHKFLHAFQPHHDVAAADRGAWQETRLRDADARVKIVFVCGAITLNLLSTDWRTSAAIIALVIGALLVDRGPAGKAILLRFLPGIMIATPLVILRTVMGPAPYAASLHAGPLTIGLSGPGLEAGILLAWKVMAGLAAAILLMTTTPLPRLLDALHWFRVPGIVVEVASLIYRYLFVLVEEGERMRNAQRLRSFKLHMGVNVADGSALVGSMFIRAYDRSERVANAQRMRGGGTDEARRPSLSNPHWAEVGVAACGLLVIGVTLVV